MSAVRQRVLHIIRHAESELNVISAHANAGYFEGVTGLDSKLSPTGHEQAKALGERILKEDISDPYLLRQSQLVVTSPLSRAILTATLSMPVSKYNYKVIPYVAEQVENTTDIPNLKKDLCKMYPELSNQFNSLPDVWWWRHPQRRGEGVDINPLKDAELLIENRGKTPSSESKYNLRGRGLKYIKWLYSDELIDGNDGNDGMRVKDTINIATFSHACTIREMELLLRSLNGTISEEDASVWHEDDWIRNNTEQLTYELPKDPNDVDWELLERRVQQVENVLNHADYEDQHK